MKTNILSFFILLTIISCTNKKETTTEKQTQKTTENMSKQLRHVVLFKFKETSTPKEVKKVEDAFDALPTQIKEIKDYERGLNNSPENLNKGFTHCFFVTFDNEEERSIYLDHSAHKAFVEILKPHLEDVLVLDYWTKTF